MARPTTDTPRTTRKLISLSEAEAHIIETAAEISHDGVFARAVREYALARAATTIQRRLDALRIYDPKLTLVEHMNRYAELERLSTLCGEHIDGWYSHARRHPDTESTVTLAFGKGSQEIVTKAGEIVWYDDDKGVWTVNDGEYALARLIRDYADEHPEDLARMAKILNEIDTVRQMLDADDSPLAVLVGNGMYGIAADLSYTSPIADKPADPAGCVWGWGEEGVLIYTGLWRVVPRSYFS